MSYGSLSRTEEQYLADYIKERLVDSHGQKLIHPMQSCCYRNKVNGYIPN